MRDDLQLLSWFYAVVERRIEVVQHPDGLVARHQGSSRNNNAVSPRQIGTLPEILPFQLLAVSNVAT